MTHLGESELEDWLEALGYEILRGLSIAPGEPAAERSSYDQVILEGRLRAALKRLNPSIPAECLDDVVRRLERQEVPSLVLSVAKVRSNTVREKEEQR